MNLSKYFIVYTDTNIPLCYVKTDFAKTPSEVCADIGCKECQAKPITKDIYEELLYDKNNDWDINVNNYY